MDYTERAGLSTVLGVSRKRPFVQRSPQREQLSSAAIHALTVFYVPLLPKPQPPL